MGTANTNDDAALGLPLGPTNIDGEDVLGDPFDFDLVGSTPPIRPHDGTKPGPTTPGRTDAASLDEHLAKYDADLRANNERLAEANQSLLNTFTKPEQVDLLKALHHAYWARAAIIRNSKGGAA